MLRFSLRLIIIIFSDKIATIEESGVLGVNAHLIFETQGWVRKHVNLVETEVSRACRELIYNKHTSKTTQLGTKLFGL